MSTESEVQEQKTEAQYATQASLISCVVTNNQGVELPPLNGDMILGFIPVSYTHLTLPTNREV